MTAEGEDFEAGFYGEAFGRFEELGERSVRQMLSSGGIVPKDREAALVWLGERDRLAISRQAALLTAANAAASAALEAARVARHNNRLTMIVIAVSVISMAFQVIGKGP